MTEEDEVEWSQRLRYRHKAKVGNWVRTKVGGIEGEVFQYWGYGCFLRTVDGLVYEARDNEVDVIERPG